MVKLVHTRNTDYKEIKNAIIKFIYVIWILKFSDSSYCLGLITWDLEDI